MISECPKTSGHDRIASVGITMYRKECVFQVVVKTQLDVVQIFRMRHRIDIASRIEV